MKFFLLWLCYCSCYAHDDDSDPINSDSVCFDNCNNHGSCVNFVCSCDPNWHGDACNVRLVPHDFLPLSTGHLVSSPVKLAALIKSSPTNDLLISFSSTSCAKCAFPEDQYAIVANHLSSSFVRIDAASPKNKDLLAKYSITTLPALIYVTKKGRHTPYNDVHTSEQILAYVHKQRSPPSQTLSTVDQLVSFHSLHDKPDQVVVLGIFTSHDSIEEDEYEDFCELSEQLRPMSNVFVAEVTSDALVQQLREHGIAERSPSVLIFRNSHSPSSSPNPNSLPRPKPTSTPTPISTIPSPSSTFFLNEQTSSSLLEWVADESVDSMIYLTDAAKFTLVERRKKPMVMLFVNGASSHSANISNRVLAAEFRVVAEALRDKYSFVVADGNDHSDRMRSLNLPYGKYNLPAIAINDNIATTSSSKNAVFPFEVPINRDTITKFCSQYHLLRGRSGRGAIDDNSNSINSSALLASSNKNNLVDRSVFQNELTSRGHILEKGVAENFDNAYEEYNVVKLEISNFEKLALDDEKDSLVMIHSSKFCGPCAHLTVYYKHLGKRFGEIETGDTKNGQIVVGEIDIEGKPEWHTKLPEFLPGIDTNQIPMIFFLPAGRKEAPFLYYSGEGKVKAMMLWVQENSNKNYNLTSLPHLTEKEELMFREQVGAREKMRRQQQKQQQEEL